MEGRGLITMFVVLLNEC